MPRTFRGRARKLHLIVPALLALALPFIHGCGGRPHESIGAVKRTFSGPLIASYNLHDFCYADRDGNGQADNFRDQEGMAAIASVLAAVDPDIIAFQGIGGSAALPHLHHVLKDAELELPYVHTAFPDDPGQTGMALFSRIPFDHATQVTNIGYTISGVRYSFTHGLQRIDFESTGTPFTLFHAHLKSREYHPAGQTEMRRNEARLLASLIRDLNRQSPDRRIIAAGDFSDDSGSAALRELLSVDDRAGLKALDLCDEAGDVWTVQSDKEHYTRSSFLLVNPAMMETIAPGAYGIVNTPETRHASPNRPVYVFIAK